MRLAVLAAVLLLSSPASAFAQGFDCVPKALGCVEVSGGEGANIPVTFGHPFAPGALRAASALALVDDMGVNLPVQLDQVVSHADGSVRFAIISTILPELTASRGVIVNLIDGVPEPAATATFPPTPDLRIELETYAAQLTRVTFGNRDGTTPGLPFAVGESVTLVVGDERYTLTVTSDQAGGGHETLTKLAEAFVPLVNKSPTFRAEKLGEGGGYENLRLTTREQPGKPFTVRFEYGGRAQIQTHVIQPWQDRRRWAASIKNAPPPSPWLQGRVVSEASYSVGFVPLGGGAAHPLLAARVNLRQSADNASARADVVVENTWAYQPKPSNLTYDVAIRNGEQTLFQQAGIRHYHHARWHKLAWLGQAPAVTIRHSARHFLDSRATWNYDTRLGVSDRILQDLKDRLKAAPTGPMEPAFLTLYMPTSGGRADIGPVPRWTALFLSTQDPRAKAAMLANADAGASVPIHYRDRATGQPLSLDEHPGVTFSRGKSSDRDALPAVENGDTPWTPDDAHQPSLAYIPYLATGDQFYLDEVLFWANWDMGHLDPAYRGGARGLVYEDQVRAQAWNLRALGEAARIVPDRHPMAGYFKGKLAGNLAWYVTRYPRNHDGLISPRLGWVEKNDGPGTTAPWQNDFLALVVGQLAEAGDPQATELFRWLARFTVGRWTSQSAGFCRAMAPAYYIRLRDGIGRPIDDWGALFRANWPQMKGCPSGIVEGEPASSGGYAAVSRAMLAVAAGLGVDGANEAYVSLRADTPAMSAAMMADPTWAIVPRGEGLW